MPCPPILMIVFNRPEHTAKIFQEIRKARPSRLYIAVDGARKEREDDQRNINAILNIVSDIDWECSVQRLVRERNLGCKIAVSSAITWFFEHEEKGIILEDDCLPSPAFFDYCGHLLEKHKENESVMHISGVNFQGSQRRGRGSYFYSKICHVWGWASWRRAWEKYDIDMHGLDVFFDDGLYKSVITNPESYRYFKDELSAARDGRIDTWDYAWVFSIWKHNGLCIYPNTNLITNIGFDAQATHTKSYDRRVANRILGDFDEAIKDVDVLAVDADADLYSFKFLFQRNTTFQRRLMQKIDKVLRGSLKRPQS